MKTVWHSASQSCPIDRSDPDARCGNMCTYRACLVRSGRSNSAVCVAFMVASLGMMTSAPVFVGLIFLIGSTVWTTLSKKWSIAPVSATVGVVIGECDTIWFTLLYFIVFRTWSYCPLYSHLVSPSHCGLCNVVCTFCCCGVDLLLCRVCNSMLLALHLWGPVPSLGFLLCAIFCFLGYCERMGRSF